MCLPLLILMLAAGPVTMHLRGLFPVPASGGGLAASTQSVRSAEVEPRGPADDPFHCACGAECDDMVGCQAVTTDSDAQPGVAGHLSGADGPIAVSADSTLPILRAPPRQPFGLTVTAVTVARI